MLRLRSKPKLAEISLEDWLLLKAPDLKAMGLDPGLRLNVTGHVTAFSPVWAQTVGLWCVAETNDIVGPEGALAGVERRTFDTYKHRHGLRTRSQFKARYGTGKTWKVAEVVHDAYEAHQQRSGDLLGFGEPAADVGKRVGVLPVEAVLYGTLFHEMLEFNKLKREDWEELNNEERTTLWDYGPNDRAWSIDAIYKRKYADPY